MRRLSLFLLALAAVAVPAGASAAHRTVGDGTLVVRNGEAPKNVPVVVLHVTGSVIGQVLYGGKIVIDAGPKGTAEVTGADGPEKVSPLDSAQKWSSPDGFKFRAVGGTFTILVYGSGVYVFAVGSGSVQVAGMPDTPKGDGRYSLEGAEFKSLPGTQTAKLFFGDND